MAGMQSLIRFKGARFAGSPNTIKPRIRNIEHVDQCGPVALKVIGSISNLDVSGTVVLGSSINLLFWEVLRLPIARNVILGHGFQ